jgi:hypothetical protein
MKWRYSVKIGKKSTWSAGVAIAFSTMLIATGCASDTESAAGDGNPAETPSFTKGILKSLSKSGRKKVSLLFFFIDILPQEYR